jgi:hypothetical protein
MIDFWPNCAANGHILIVTLDVNSEMGERSEWVFSLIIENNNARDLWFSCNCTVGNI